jgi:hypothetical protein
VRLATVLLVAAVLACGPNAATTSPTPEPTPEPPSSPILALRPDGLPTFVPGTRKPATPTPERNAGTIYRLEGVVVDEQGTPISDVCIAIGPNGCQPHSPRTDDRGVYIIDLPDATNAYDFHFTRDGYQEVVRRLSFTRDQVLNLVLTH